MSVDPSDHLLEIGCGRGVAVSLVCDELVDGRITAIDRSASMIRIAEQRNRSCVASGKAVLEAVALDRWDPAPTTRYDKIFAVNVSLFWLQTSAKEFAIVKRSLKPGGVLFLFYEQPGADRAAKIAQRLAVNIAKNELTTTATSMAPTRRSTTMLSVTARAS